MVIRGRTTLRATQRMEQAITGQDLKAVDTVSIGTVMAIANPCHLDI